MRRLQVENMTNRQFMCQYLSYKAQRRSYHNNIKLVDDALWWRVRTIAEHNHCHFKDELQIDDYQCCLRFWNQIYDQCDLVGSAEYKIIRSLRIEAMVKSNSNISSCSHVLCHDKSPSTRHPGTIAEHNLPRQCHVIEVRLKSPYCDALQIISAESYCQAWEPTPYNDILIRRLAIVVGSLGLIEGIIIP